MNPGKHNSLIQLWLIVGIVAGFSAIIFFSVTYLNEKVLCDLDCRIRNEVSIMIVLLSLFGMFVGSITYYFISEKYEKRIIKIHKDMDATLRFLDGEERAVIKSLIDNKGESSQAELSKKTGISRVKISRCLKKLEEKKLVLKSPSGMTNKVSLDKAIKDLFFND